MFLWFKNTNLLGLEKRCHLPHLSYRGYRNPNKLKTENDLSLRLGHFEITINKNK